ncbi:probable mediator of RNA polymerase II transcription subunit 26b [Malania oleifera]|uniref:probable mediator of RNA polymerase II transcription subunit 26b n=1 Tax=Malania oleifera TaxID=397392 RepID=UPI0025AE1EC0|nr:probable mediator of RNA polymerase II transcription subunit 26b [Malania oleifera]
MASGGLDRWRNYFRSANADIFEIIENAIAVAASDCPKEFRQRRDRIAERLFSCKLTQCSGCARVELTVPRTEEDEGCKSGFDGDGCEFGAGASKGSKIVSSRDDSEDMILNHISNYSYGEAEALTDEIEEERRIVGEVLRIKEIFQNSQDEPQSVLYESLRKLQLMALTVDTLEATEIGKAVNDLRKHGSVQIRQLARKLIIVWKGMVDQWMNATNQTIAERTPDSVNPSVVDDEEEDEGLPSPPMDDIYFATTQTATMDISQFFDEMDDDGNPRNSGECIKNHENGRKPSIEKPHVPKLKQQPPNEANVIAKDNGQLMKRPEAVMKTNKPSNTECGPGRPMKPKSSVQQKVNHETKCQQKQEKVANQRRLLAAQQNIKCKDEEELQQKLEVTKRKLHERYQEVENAKKQRTIQVMELHDLPKQGVGHRNPHMRPGSNNNQQWKNGRR